MRKRSHKDCNLIAIFEKHIKLSIFITRLYFNYEFIHHIEDLCLTSESGQRQATAWRSATRTCNATGTVYDEFIDTQKEAPGTTNYILCALCTRVQLGERIIT